MYPYPEQERKKLTLLHVSALQIVKEFFGTNPGYNKNMSS